MIKYNEDNTVLTHRKIVETRIKKNLYKNSPSIAPKHANFGATQ